MLKIVAEFRVNKDSLEQFLGLAKVIVEKTVALDKGCVSYSLCQDTADPLHCSIIEEWENQELLDEHMKTAHFIEIVPKLSDTCVSPPAITLYNKLF